MDSKALIAFGTLLLVAIFLGQEVTGLKCHQCNSYDEALCDDPFYDLSEDGKEKLPKTLDFLKECPNDSNEYTLCRKTYQKVRDDVRIIRSCGWIDYKGEKDTCYKTVLEEYNTMVCSCETEGCNGGSSMGVSVFAILASVVGAMFVVGK